MTMAEKFKLSCQHGHTFLVPIGTRARGAPCPACKAEAEAIDALTESLTFLNEEGSHSARIQLALDILTPAEDVFAQAYGPFLRGEEGE